MYLKKPISIFISFLFSSVLLSSSSVAQTSRVISVDFKSCVPSVELCGNGVDEDCDGKDLECPGDDKDRDGFSSSSDCDDTDHFIYPGISVVCNASCGQGYQTCQSGGSYSECTCAPLCEAPNGSRCYYVDPIRGYDTNTGDFTSRLKTLSRITHSSPSSSNPINLAPGDVVYLFSGKYAGSYDSYGKQRVFSITDIRATSSKPVRIKAYPGEFPVFTPPSHNKTEGVYVLNSEYVELEGFTVDGSYQAGIMIADSRHVNVKNVVIRNTDGPDNDNMAGLYTVGSSDIDVSHSVLYDNYDRTASDTGGRSTENARNIVFFKGGDIRVHHSALFHTPLISAQKTGACIAYKHSQSISNSKFTVDHTTMQNCKFNAIGITGFNGFFHHNLIVNSDIAFRIKDHGGSPNFHHNLIEYNTLVNTVPIEYNPSEAVYFNKRYDHQIYRNNIVSDNKRYLSQATATFMIDPYGANTLHDDVLNNSLFEASNNCYYSSEDDSMFSFYTDNSSANTSRGGAYTLSEWQSLGFDQGSVEVDPELNNFFIPEEAACSQAGYMPSSP